MNVRKHGPDSCSDNAFSCEKLLAFDSAQGFSEILGHPLQYRSCFLQHLIQPPFLIFLNINCHISSSLEAEPKRRISVMQFI